MISIHDDCGNIVASYCYDAWGKVLNVWNFTDANIGDLNPFRYRSYYYDTETGLYYLNSRYYDPETGRFINADDTKYLGNGNTLSGYNLFVYCGNNPIAGYDPTGKWDWGLFGKIVLTTVVVAACLTGVGAIAAAAATAAATSVTAAVTTAVATAGISITCSAVDGAICAEASGGNWYDGFMAGAIGGSVGVAISKITNPAPGSDMSLRMNTAGRTVSSAVYDVTYEYFNSGSVSPEQYGLFALDIIMDDCLSTIGYYYTDTIGNGYVTSFLNGFMDGVVDVFQTFAFF